MGAKIVMGSFFFLAWTVFAACSSRTEISLEAPDGTEPTSPNRANAVKAATPEADEVGESSDRAVERSATPSVSAEVASDPTEETIVEIASVPTKSPPPTLVPGAWMELPVMPQISDTAMMIFQRGQAQGRDPHRFSKVGDCQNVSSLFLSAFDDPRRYTLGEDYSPLQETIDWYQGSFSRDSEAVRGGLNAASELSPLWADPQQCEAGEGPLTCEIRLHNPSVAIISLETWWAGKPENYERYLRQVIEVTIDRNVVPILGTKADNLEGDYGINSIIADLATEYDIPLWNFWLAVQPLPNHGLLEDGFHLTVAGNIFDDPAHLKAAWPWRNLTALQALDAVRRAVVEP